MATQLSGHNRLDDEHYANSREIQQDIERTRHEMDETLEQLGERLHPKHALDYVLDYFRSPGASSRQAAAGLREAGGFVADEMRRHPVPFALFGAGVAWWLMESSQRDSGDSRSSEYRQAHFAGEGVRPAEWDDAAQWSQQACAWHPEYDWSQAEQDERSWGDRARGTLASLKSTLSDSTRSAGEKVKQAAASVVSLSGHKQQAIHSRWADLEEHSGSFVDARTGKPYDESYGREWRNLAAASYLAESGTAEQSETWKEKAGRLTQDLQHALATGGENVKETLRSMATKFGDFASGTADFSRHYAGKMGRGAGTMAGRTSAGVNRLTSGAKQVGGRMQHGVQDGYQYTRRQVADTMDEYPLAAGAAAFGLGLVAGFLLPHSRTEDRWMGEAAEDLRDRAKEAAEEALHRGQEVASATATAAVEEAQRQGLTPTELGQKVRSAMDKAGGAAQEKFTEATGGITEKARSVANKATQAARAETAKQRRELNL